MDKDVHTNLKYSVNYERHILISTYTWKDKDSRQSLTLWESVQTMWHSGHMNKNLALRQERQSKSEMIWPNSIIFRKWPVRH